MKVPEIWVFFLVVGTALLVFTFSSSSSISGNYRIGGWCYCEKHGFDDFDGVITALTL
ncbi:hypothetical protein CRYUN_Cryun34aG0023100 [Craigia yunnanensis]